MLARNLLRASILSCVGAVLFILTIGCTEKENPEPNADTEKSPLVYGQKVQGKVTYKGQPVTYGLVLLYNDQHSFSAEKRTFAPVAFGPITSEGTYSLENAPLGVHRLVVATDPEQDVMVYTRPIPMDGAIAKDLNQGPPGMGPPGMGPPGVPGPPAKGQEGKAPPKATKGQKLANPGYEPPRDSPPPAFAIPAPVIPNPKFEKMSDAEKRLLREVHARYGSFDKSTRLIVVREGSQTFDIELK